MNKKLFNFISVVSLVSMFLISPVYSEVIKSDWIKAKEGEQGERVGVKVIAVDQIEELTMVTIDAPIESIEDYVAYIVIKVGGDKVEKLPLNWIVDEKNEYRGLRFKLNKKPGFDFRLILKNQDAKKSEK